MKSDLISRSKNATRIKYKLILPKSCILRNIINSNNDNNNGNNNKVINNTDDNNKLVCNNKRY